MEDLLGFRKRLVEASAAVGTSGPCHVDYKPKVYSPRREGLALLSRPSQPAPQSTHGQCPLWQGGKRHSKCILHWQQWDNCPRRRHRGSVESRSFREVWRAPWFLEKAGRREEQMRLTHEAGRPAVWAHTSRWHLGSCLRPLSHPAPNSTLLHLQPLPRGRRLSFLMSQATLADPGPTAGVQEPITKGKIIRG